MEFKEICNRLDNYCDKCDKEKNKVVCAKQFISNEFKDENSLLELKAQAMEEDFGNGLSLLLSEAGSAISVLGLLLSAVSTLAGKLQILKYAMFDTG